MSVFQISKGACDGCGQLWRTGSAKFSARYCHAATIGKGFNPNIHSTLWQRPHEMGQLNNKQISALLGVAPFNKDSGRKSGKRVIRGGRAAIRSALYMPMLSAIQHNKPIKTFYQRLIKRGKLKIVAVIASMRKLIVFANAMLKNNADWNPNFNFST